MMTILRLYEIVIIFFRLITCQIFVSDMCLPRSLSGLIIRLVSGPDVCLFFCLILSPLSLFNWRQIKNIVESVYERRKKFHVISKCMKISPICMIDGKL